MYKTLYLKANPNFEYQRRGGNWVKRPKGTKGSWYPLDANGNRVLSETYSDKPALFFYSNNFFIGGAIVLGIVGFIVLKKRTKNAPII